MSKRERLPSAEVPALALRLMDCPRCRGSGFSGRGSGYDDVCSECGGQQQVPAKINLMVDSGAFSAWQSGAVVDLKAYIEWLKQHKDQLFSYVALDVMPDEGMGTISPNQCARASYKNLQVMLDAGLKPIPVFHQGESFWWLARLLKDGHDYIGIGGSATLSLPKRVEWLNEVFTLLCDKDGLPCVKTHGFGMGSPDLIWNYPFYTVDSTTWIGSPGFGRFVIPDAERVGKAAARDAGRSSKGFGSHLVTLGKEEREVVDKYLALAGVTLEGLQESYIGRAKVISLLIEDLKTKRAAAPCQFGRWTNRHDAEQEWASFIAPWGIKRVIDEWPRPDLTPLRVFNVGWGNVMNHILNVANHNDRLMSYLNILKWDDKQMAEYIQTGFPSPYVYKGRP